MKTPIVILHGWRVGGERYHEIKNLFEHMGHRVYTPDLPGMGEVKLTKDIMSIDDYVDWVEEYLKENHLNKVILIGHSFGGRISAKLAARHPKMIEKLILTGAPLIRRKLSLKKHMLSLVAKGGKVITQKAPKPIGNFLRKVLYYALGEWDYYKTNDSLRETFKRVVNEDLVTVLPKILVPTLVVWGEYDKLVPVSDGKEIAAKIRGSVLDIIHGATHALPYDHPREFVEAVDKFIA